MLRLRGRVKIDTERMVLRPPQHNDFRPWSDLRRASAEFLQPWEPAWSADHLTRKGFVNRVYWANRSIQQGTAVPLFLIRRTDNAVLGAITLDNIRRGPAQAGTIGYWIGEDYARQGYMREALTAVVHHSFEVLGLSRLESACLPENKASRALLERCGYKYEGVAQSYLQINGRWRNHVLYANLRRDRRGRVEG
ncbi:MAG: GNAT family N-acetyltransferase [Silicimonas sp.]|nr:GNAT family N-acetyltransferase [Silicimonas sp.]